MAGASNSLQGGYFKAGRRVAAERGFMIGVMPPTAGANNYTSPDGKYQVFGAAGAASVTIPTTFLVTAGGALAVSLAASTQTTGGMMKTFVMIVDGGGDATLTPSAVAGFQGAATTAVFNNVNDTCVLQWNGSAWRWAGGTATQA